MTLHRLFLLMVFLFMLPSPRAISCGFCVEDRVASVYDHAVVIHALKAGHHVVFCSVGMGNYQLENLVQILNSAFNLVTGIDKGSIRISLENLAVAFAFNPAHGRQEQILASVRSQLAKDEILIEVLRIMKEPAQLDKMELKLG